MLTKEPEVFAGVRVPGCQKLQVTA